MYAYAQSKVEICGVNTAKLQTLKNDEMRELLDRSHHGDKDARDKLICGNLRLVLSVIQRFPSRGDNLRRSEALSARQQRRARQPFHA